MSRTMAMVSIVTASNEVARSTVDGDTIRSSSVGFSPRFPKDHTPAWAKAHATGTIVGNICYGSPSLAVLIAVTVSAKKMGIL